MTRRHRGSTMCAVGLLAWTLTLGIVACAKDPPRAPRAENRRAPPVVRAASRPAVPSGATPTATRFPLVPSPAGPDTEPDAALQTYPVRLFAPFTRLHAAELGRPFAESFRVRIVPNEPAREVSSCTALLELALTHEPDLEPGTELDIQAFWSTAVECLALRMVAGARPAQRSRLEQVVWVEDPSGLLPPLLGMIDFFDERKRVGAAAARCRSWRAYDKSLRMTKQNADVFMIATDAWSGELSLYARGDFDADGYEDLLVRRDGSAEGGGSFEASALFMLSQTDADRCIRVARELGRS